jgi:hypothetical protein
VRYLWDGSEVLNTRTEYRLAQQNDASDVALNTIGSGIP